MGDSKCFPRSYHVVFLKLDADLKTSKTPLCLKYQSEPLFLSRKRIIYLCGTNTELCLKSLVSSLMCVLHCHKKNKKDLMDFEDF